MGYGATRPPGNDEEMRLSHPFRRQEQDQTGEAQGDALMSQLMAEERPQAEQRRRVVPGGDVKASGAGAGAAQRGWRRE